MRLKRPSPLSGRGLDRGTKLRRVASSGNAVGVIPEPQPVLEQPPSTSQLPNVTPCSCGSSPNRGTCSQCISCHCVYCPHANQSHMQCNHQAQQAVNPAPAVQQVTRDAREMQDQTQLAAQRIRAANDAFWSQQLAALDHHQRQLAVGTPLTFRPFPLPGSTSLYVLPRTGFPGAVAANGRMIEFNMLVNVVPSELLGVAGDPRPILERHHVFGAPVAEPQPVGATIDDIEKNTCKSEFIKDIEIPDDEKERCTVCLNDFETGEGVRTLKCDHLFHVDCIDRWLVYNKKCPVCRLEVDKEKKAAVLIE